MPKTCKLLHKGWNFAKSGHTDSGEDCIGNDNSFQEIDQSQYLTLINAFN